MAGYIPIYTTTDPADQNDLAGLRDALFARDGLQHYATIGYFLQWFAGVELAIDLLLAWVSGNTDPVKFEILIRGLPPRSKCERLRSLCKQSSLVIGPNLAARLKHFELKVCPVRNYVAHSIAVHGSDVEHIQFIGYAHWDGFEPKGRTKGAFILDSLELFEHGTWLHLFAMDLQDSKLFQPPKGTYEIASPRSGLPKASSQGSQTKAPLAKPDKPARKASPKSSRNPSSKRKNSGK